jgi:short-subunit dehydrogenase
LFHIGANSGIGKETALDFAKRGARIILLCRNVDKAKVAAEDITRQHSKAQVTIQKIDLASLKSVRNCAQNLLDTEDKIDFLVNNAGNNFF